MNKLWVPGILVSLYMIANTGLLVLLIRGVNDLATMIAEQGCEHGVHEWVPATAWPWQQHCARCGAPGFPGMTESQS